MANLIEMAKSQADSLLQAAYGRAVAGGRLPEGGLRGSVEIPKDTRNGDYAANHAMAAAKSMHMAPRRVAEELLACLELEGSYFSACEIAGPGFLNFRLAPAWYAAVLHNIISEGDGSGRVQR